MRMNFVIDIGILKQRWGLSLDLYTIEYVETKSYVLILEGIRFFGSPAFWRRPTRGLANKRYHKSHNEGRRHTKNK